MTVTKREQQIQLGFSLPAKKPRGKPIPAWVRATHQLLCVHCCVSPRTPGRRTCAECRAYLASVVERAACG